MQPISREDDDKQTYAYARKLESDFTIKYHELDKRVTVVEKQIEGLGEKQEETCKLLRQTEAVVNAKLDLLLADKNQRDGQTKERKQWPEYAGLLVSIGTLFGMLYVVFELLNK